MALTALLLAVGVLASARIDAWEPYGPAQTPWPEGLAIAPECPTCSAKARTPIALPGGTVRVRGFADSAEGGGLIALLPQTADGQPLEDMVLSWFETGPFEGARDPDPRATSARLYVRWTGSPVVLRDVVVEPVRARPIWQILWSAATLGWTAWFAVAAGFVIARLRPWWRAAAIVPLATAMVIGSALPGDAEIDALSARANAPARVERPVVTTAVHDATVSVVRVATLRKMLARDEVQHLCGFAVLGALVLVGRPRVADAGRIAGFGAITEVIQGLTVDRAPSLTDYALDLVGLGAAAALAWVVAQRGSTRSTSSPR